VQAYLGLSHSKLTWDGQGYFATWSNDNTPCIPLQKTWPVVAVP